jgi:hypothetical protein
MAENISQGMNTLTPAQWCFQGYSSGVPVVHASGNPVVATRGVPVVTSCVLVVNSGVPVVPTCWDVVRVDFTVIHQPTG